MNTIEMIKVIKKRLPHLSKDELDSVVELGIVANHEIVERVSLSDFDAMQERS